MGQISRVMLSSVLITCLGCGRLPAQAHMRAPAVSLPQAAQLDLGAPSSASLDLSIDEQEQMLVHDDHLEDPDETALGVSEDVMALEVAEPEADDPAERVLRLYDLHDRTLLELTVSKSGAVSEADRPQMEYFFRCRRTQQTHSMASGVLKILYAVDRAFPGHVLEIVSGFRTYPFGVRDSKHYEGHAIDLRLRGVRTSRVRDFVWRHFADVGVGYYGHHNFVHVDYRPEEKDTAWTSPEPNAAYAYNPGWALRIRPPWRAPRALTDAL